MSEHVDKLVADLSNHIATTVETHKQALAELDATNAALAKAKEDLVAAKAGLTAQQQKNLSNYQTQIDKKHHELESLAPQLKAVHEEFVAKTEQLNAAGERFLQIQNELAAIKQKL